MNKSILVVDDNESWRAIFREILEEAGYLCDLAGSPDEAIEKLGHKTYAMVVLDWSLYPWESQSYEMGSGKIVLDWLLANNSQTKVIVVSGHIGLEKALPIDTRIISVISAGLLTKEFLLTSVTSGLKD